MIFGYRFAIFALFGLVSLHVFAISVEFSEDELSVKKEEAKPGTAVYFYRAGLEFLVDKKIDQAKRAFEKSLALDKSFVSAYIGLAEVASQLGQPKAIKRNLDQALGIAPANPFALLSRARYYYSERRYEDAEVDLKLAVKANPTFTKAYVTLGDLYANVGKNPQQAIDAYIKALEINPGHAGARFALGAVYKRTEQNDLAIEQYEKVAVLQPENPIAYYQVGQIRLADKDYSAARKMYDRALKIDARFAPAHIGLGDAASGANRPDEAVSHYEDALVINSENTEANYKMGLLKQSQGDLVAAKKFYLVAVEKDPKLVAALNNLAWISIELNEDLKQSVKWAEQALALIPQSSAIMDTLGWAYYANGDKKKALKVLLDAKSIKSDSASVLYHLAVVQADLGEKDLAKQNFDRVIQNVESRYAEKAQEELDKL